MQGDISVDDLNDGLKKELLQFVKRCVDCGEIIVGSGAKKRCAECNRKHLNRQRVEYGKKNFRSLHYEHDNYISRPGRKTA